MKDFVQNEICGSHTLLYLCKFGSHLYGTAGPNSDVDYKGIFLPDRKELLLGNKVKSLHYKTGDDSSRNSNEDMDVDLWSIQYFFELVGKGETNAIDLIYSPTNEKCVEYVHPILSKYVFSEPLRFFNPVNCNAFIGYSKHQIKKYGSAATRLGVLKQVYDFLMENDYIFSSNPDIRLSQIVEHILDKFYDKSYCFMKEVNEEESLVLCGKIHLFSIRLSEFHNRVKREYEKYGQRVKDAYENKNVDWKAVSHSLRCLYQMEELLTNGYIQFPLKESKYLLEIKEGKYDFQQIDQVIQDKLDSVDHLQKSTTVKGENNNKLKEYIILNLYNEYV